MLRITFAFVLSASALACATTGSSSPAPEAPPAPYLERFGRALDTSVLAAVVNDTDPALPAEPRPRDTVALEKLRAYEGGDLAALPFLVDIPLDLDLASGVRHLAAKLLVQRIEAAAAPVGTIVSPDRALFATAEKGPNLLVYKGRASICAYGEASVRGLSKMPASRRGLFRGTAAQRARASVSRVVKSTVTRVVAEDDTLGRYERTESTTRMSLRAVTYGAYTRDEGYAAVACVDLDDYAERLSQGDEAARLDPELDMAGNLTLVEALRAVARRTSVD